MPASRSRTDHWQDCLRKLHERGGAIEISISRGPAVAGTIGTLEEGADLVWRVRLLSLSTSEIVVESPAAFGANMDLRTGIDLIGAMTIGQNRWMFRTRSLAQRGAFTPEGHPCRGLVLAAPSGMERCLRRQFYRTSTAGVTLPTVQCWPLLDASTVIAAETANRLAIERSAATPGTPMPTGLRLAETEPPMLPEVGPEFQSHLLNLSGGGLGLRINRKDAGAIERRHHFWLRLDLRPDIALPVAVTTRLAHTHIDSEQNLYAGMAFDFAYNPAHREFVLAVFARYLDSLQSRQRMAA